MKYLSIALVVFLMTANIFAQNQNTRAGFATIKEVTGTVEVKAPGSANFIPAKTGDRVANAAIISTGFKSTAVLETGSSAIRVQPLTRLSLETLLDMNNAGSETANLELRTGRVRVDVNPPAGNRANFNVQTPSSTASVRGTNFEMDSSNLKVNEGTVRFGAASGAQGAIVIAGQNARVNTVTGKTVNSFDTAEINRALPAMPGEGSLSAGGASKPKAEGRLVAEIILESK